MKNLEVTDYRRNIIVFFWFLIKDLIGDRKIRGRVPYLKAVGIRVRH
jgi:hypothetical protein